MNSSKSRSIPSGKKSKMGAKLAMENAERHYRCAKHLHEINEFGIAQSHLVLCVEEAIKSVFLFYKGLGIPIRQNILNDLLNKHKLRHEIGGGLYFIISLMMWMFTTILIAVKDTKGKTNQEVQLVRKQAINKIINNLRKSAESDSDKIEVNRVILPPMRWWKEADEKKKAGFYVDFWKGNWYSPNMITKEKYLQSLEIANNVIQNTKEVYEIIESLSEEEQSEIVNELKSRYKKVIKSYKEGNNTDD